MIRRKAFLSLFCLASLTGCGGGGGGGASGVVPRVALSWGARGRATSAPPSALSVSIRLTGAAADGSDIEFRANRPSGAGAQTQNYPFPVASKLGEYPLTALAYSLPNGGGSIVGRAETRVVIPADGALPDIALAGQVASLEIGAGQKIGISESKSLAVTARTASGEVLAITEDSYVWNVLAGGERLTVSDGRLLGVAPGVAQVRATVDGAFSPTASVTVESGAVVTVTPSSVELSVRGTQGFSASVSGTNGGAEGVIWSLTEGAAAGSVTAEGLYSAPDTPGIYHLVATSLYDPSRAATVELRVVSGSLSVGGTWQDTGGLGIAIR